MKRTIIALLLLTAICFAAGCNAKTAGTAQYANEGGQTPSAPVDANEPAAGQTPPSQPPPTQTTPPLEQPRLEKLEEQMENTIHGTITMEDGGVIEIELYPDLAPQSVRNFVYLARDGFYDGLVFHRIMKGFMIQGGCPLGTGTGNPGYSIKGEFIINGFKNELSHTRGVISMARSNDFDSAGSQFFIVHEDSQFLDTKYAAFGRVTEGMDVVDRLAEIPVIDNNGTVADKNKPVIKSITIDDDIELPEPNRIND